MKHFSYQSAKGNEAVTATEREKHKEYYVVIRLPRNMFMINELLCLKMLINLCLSFQQIFLQPLIIGRIVKNGYPDTNFTLIPIMYINVRLFYELNYVNRYLHYLTARVLLIIFKLHILIEYM